MKLVDNANMLHKTYSVILSVILALVSFIEFGGKELLPILNDFLPENYFPLVSGVFSILIILGRYIKQPKLTQDTEDYSYLNMKDDSKE